MAFTINQTDPQSPNGGLANPLELAASHRVMAARILLRLIDVSAANGGGYSGSI
jgi:hypothetical protein